MRKTKSKAVKKSAIADKLSSERNIGSAHGGRVSNLDKLLAIGDAAIRAKEKAVKTEPDDLKLVTGFDNMFEILVDAKGQPYIRIRNEKPKRATFREALIHYAHLWPYHNNGHYGDDVDYADFFRSVAFKLPEGV